MPTPVMLHETEAQTRRGAMALLQAARPHQWAKNLLLFIPLAASHQITVPDLLGTTLVALVVFSLGASAVYVANDLADVSFDRLHPLKKHRPFASGALGPRTGVFLSLALGAAAVGLSLAFLPLLCLALLAGYALVAGLYTAFVKRIPILDVLTLAGLYTLRILFGAAAVAIPVSNWLLAFSMFLFLSLAFLKRYAELSLLQEMDGTGIPGRGYEVDDADLVRGFGSASGYLSVLVLALYIHSSEEAEVLYRDPSLLWLLGPCLLYWITRIWLIAHRGRLREDPVLFAVRDPVSYAVGLIGAIVILAASL